MNAIVAVDNNWAIGCKNRLLVRIPADHKNFRQETVGKVVVLGRKTLETFPQGMPLPERTNIVLSANRDYKVKGAVVVHDREELMAELSKYPTRDIYIIGGESVYRMMLPECDVVHVTRMKPGRSRRTVRSRRILTCHTVLSNMREKGFELTVRKGPLYESGDEGNCGE